MPLKDDQGISKEMGVQTASCENGLRTDWCICFHRNSNLYIIAALS